MLQYIFLLMSDQIIIVPIACVLMMTSSDNDIITQGGSATDVTSQ